MHINVSDRKKSRNYEMRGMEYSKRALNCSLLTHLVQTAKSIDDHPFFFGIKCGNPSACFSNIRIQSSFFYEN